MIAGAAVGEATAASDWAGALDGAGEPRAAGAENEHEPYQQDHDADVPRWANLRFSSMSDDSSNSMTP
mgnify:CR=1 FL=1